MRKSNYKKEYNKERKLFKIEDRVGGDT